MLEAAVEGEVLFAGRDALAIGAVGGALIAGLGEPADGKGCATPDDAMASSPSRTRPVRTACRMFKSCGLSSTWHCTVPAAVIPCRTFIRSRRHETTPPRGARSAAPIGPFVLLEVDNTVSANTYRSNLYLGGGKGEGRTPDGQETVRAEFSPGWFSRFPTGLNRDPGDLKPTAAAPFLGLVAPTPLAPADRTGGSRAGQTVPGPIEAR